MFDRTDENLKRINELWRLHESQDPKAKSAGSCLSFAVDRRYFKSDDFPEIQFRLGISFGHNPFTPEMKCGFVPPPVLPGEFVFGLHVIANKGQQLTIYDQWCDVSEAGDCKDAISGRSRALEVLAEISDENYSKMVSETNTAGPLLVSDNAELRDFEVVEGEAF